MEYWQELLSDEVLAASAGQTLWRGAYAARLPDGSGLLLPLRDLGESAVAGLIVNQASFAVFDRLSGLLSELARRFAPDVVVGLPTLGHGLGAEVARSLGHANWVAPGTSRKFWYRESLSVPLTSITTPGAGRRLWLDPRLLSRLAGRRVLVVDDVVSTGTSLQAGFDLLAAAAITPVAAVAVMLQGDRWCRTLGDRVPVAGVFATPLFAREGDAWRPRPETCRTEACPLGAVPRSRISCDI